MKKLFTLIVAICATTLAWADDSGYCGSTLRGSADLYKVHYYFESSTGTLTFSGTVDMQYYSYLSDRPWNAYSSSIKKVVIENGVTSIGKNAFSGCTGLTSVTIPNSVTSIESSAFSGCTGLTSITIGNASIGKVAFSGCTGLTSITIGNGVTSVGEEAFDGCDNIETADINSQAALDAIDNKFNDKLTSIILGDDITSIGNYAFYGCGGLTSVEIPNSVTSIGYAAFEFCEGLTSITIGNSVTSIGEEAFEFCEGLTSINVAEDNLNYASIDGVLYRKDKKTLIKCPMGKTGSVTIPNSVTSIGAEAFYLCKGLTSMTVEATTPPSYSSTYNMVSDYDIPLYVPAGSVDAYKAAKEWKKFTNIQAIPATGVNEATAEKSEVKKIIDRNGIIYIEKDGTRYFLNGGKVE